MELPIRIVIAEDWADQNTWFLALEYAKKICEIASQSVEQVILLTHTKRQLTSGSLADHMGPQASAALDKRQPVSLNGDAKLRAETLQTLKHNSKPSVIIAFFADEKLLEFIDGLDEVVGVVVVPDLRDMISDWETRWSPILHGEEQPSKRVKLIHDNVLKKTLETITLLSNISYNVIQTRDKQKAEENFRILKAKGHTLDAKLIKSWAIKRGWKPKAADELAAIAQKVANLKTKSRLSGIHDPEGRYIRWCDNLN